MFDEIEWPNSFSVARNYSMDKASGDYILILDGDEHIPDDEHWNGIRLLLQKVGNLAAIKIMVKNLVPENQLLSADCSHQVRVFRNHPAIRYEGRVHNQIFKGVKRYARETGDRIVKTDVTAIHVGYALEKERMKEKYRERLHLLEHEVENATDALRREYYRYQLGNAYFMLGEMENVVDVYDNIKYETLTNFNAFYTQFMHGFACSCIGQPGEALKHADAMRAIDDTEPISYVLSGEALSKMGKREASLVMFMKAYELNVEGKGSIRFELDDDYLFYVIGLNAARLKFFDRARFFINKYLERYPNSDKGQFVLRKINEQTGVTETQVS